MARLFKPTIDKNTFHKILDLEKWELWAQNEITSEAGWKSYKLITKKEKAKKANFKLSYNGERMAKCDCLTVLTTRNTYQNLAKKVLAAIHDDYHL